MTKLIGIYQIEKSKLYPSHCSDFHLVISKRHKASARKPIDYLLLKQAGKFIYLSSLYSTNHTEEHLQADLWHFEVKGIHYELSLNKAENKAEIRLIDNQTGGRYRTGRNQNA
jgi:hypothetical protein